MVSVSAASAAISATHCSPAAPCGAAWWHSPDALQASSVHGSLSSQSSGRCTHDPCTQASLVQASSSTQSACVPHCPAARDGRAPMNAAQATQKQPTTSNSAIVLIASTPSAAQCTGRPCGADGSKGVDRCETGPVAVCNSIRTLPSRFSPQKPLSWSGGTCGLIIPRVLAVGAAGVC